VQIGEQLTSEDCIALAKSKNQKFAAITHGGRECFAGNAKPSANGEVDIAECNSPCRFESQFEGLSCGGVVLDGHRFFIYDLKASGTKMQLLSEIQTNVKAEKKKNNNTESSETTVVDPEEETNPLLIPIAIGACVAILAIIAIVVFLCRRKKSTGTPLDFRSPPVKNQDIKIHEMKYVMTLPNINPLAPGTQFLSREDSFRSASTSGSESAGGEAPWARQRMKSVSREASPVHRVNPVNPGSQFLGREDSFRSASTSGGEEAPWTRQPKVVQSVRSYTTSVSASGMTLSGGEEMRSPRSPRSKLSKVKPGAKSYTKSPSVKSSGGKSQSSSGGKSRSSSRSKHSVVTITMEKSDSESSSDSDDARAPPNFDSDAGFDYDIVRGKKVREGRRHR
jgi:hypothetical protein